jgi:hypothetical protein
MRPNLLAVADHADVRLGAVLSNKIGTATASNKTSVAEAAFTSMMSLGRGMLTGTSAGQFPITISGSIFLLTATRYASSTLQATTTKFSVAGSLSSIQLPASALSDAFDNNASAIPATIDAIFLVCSRDIFSTTDLTVASGTSLDTAIVSLMLFDSSAPTGSPALNIANLTTEPMKFISPLGAPLAANQYSTCNTWSSPLAGLFICEYTVAS